MRTREPLAVAIVLLVLSGCGLNAPTAAGHSPAPPSHVALQTTPAATPTATPSGEPQPASNAFGILVGSAASGAQYSVSLVGTDGKVVATRTIAAPATVSCGSAAAALVPQPISASDSAVYYLEAQGGVTRLLKDGQVQRAASVPAPTASRRAMFAVSPDDQKIAVVVADFTASGASTRLYVENLDATNHVDLFSETGASTLWPVGWHGTNNLVLAKVPACRQGVGIGGNGVIEYHVVDPATGTRRFTLGGPGCTAMSSPSPGGVICEAPPKATVLGWTNSTLHTFPIQGPVGAYLSPDGGNVAFVDNIGTTFTGGGSAMAGFFTCEWIDDGNVIAGGDAQQQPRVANVTTGQVTPVQAQGTCAGRLPGGL